MLEAAEAIDGTLTCSFAQCGNYNRSCNGRPS